MKYYINVLLLITSSILSAFILINYPYVWLGIHPPLIWGIYLFTIDKIEEHPCPLKGLLHNELAILSLIITVHLYLFLVVTSWMTAISALLVLLLIVFAIRAMYRRMELNDIRETEWYSRVKGSWYGHHNGFPVTYAKTFESSDLSLLEWLDSIPDHECILLSPDADVQEQGVIDWVKNPDTLVYITQIGKPVITPVISSSLSF